MARSLLHEPTPANDTIVSEIEIAAPAERVFDALTDPQARLRWWTAGGRFTALDRQSDLPRTSHRGWPELLAALRGDCEAG